MTPNAVSQLIEAALRISSGILLVSLLAPQSISLGAAGFNFGDVVGGIGGLAYLLYLYARNRSEIWGESATGTTLTDSGFAKTATNLIRHALPISLIGSALPLMMYLDAFVLGHFHAGGSPQTIQSLYGELTAGLSIIMLPTVVTGALASALIPALAEAKVHDAIEQQKRLIMLSYKMTVRVALPAAVGLMVLGAPVYTLLFGTRQGAEYLVALALCVPPIMLQQMTASILQGLGQIMSPVKYLGVGTLAKLAVSIVAIPMFGGHGLAWGMAVGFSVATVLNLWALHKAVGRSLQLVNNVVRPVAAACLMGLVVWGGYYGLGSMSLDVTRHGGGLVVALVLLGGVVYGVSLLLMGEYSESELEGIRTLKTKITRFIKFS